MRKITTETPQKPNVIRSIFRAVNILICLSNGIDTLTKIAKHSKLSNSTTHRLLKALEESNLATYDPVKHRYYMGPLVNQLSSNPQTTHTHLITCAIPEIRRLWYLTGETVALNIMIGIQYVRLHEIQSRHSLTIIEGDDPVGPLYVGATAKVLLSQLGDKELRIAMRYIETGRVTEHSVTDKNVLMAQSKEIRERGYAVSYGERILGALCISAPIRDYFWPAALSLVGPESRIKASVDELVTEVMISASSISRNIMEFFEAKGVIVFEKMTKGKTGYLESIKEVTH